MCVCVCLSVCVCVCVSKKKNADGTAFKKMSVEHGDLKKIKNYSGFQNSYEPRTYSTWVRGCTESYEIRNYSGIRTTSLWDPRNNN